MNAKLYHLPQIPSSEIERQTSTKLELWFLFGDNLELNKTIFRSPSLPSPICAVRGKTAGAYTTTTTFQWTSAVQALSILLLKAVVRERSDSDAREPLLEGSSNSLAASLDAALYKQTAWLDLLGWTASGDPLSRRILRRTNPGRRRPGPVMISLNQNLLPPSAIVVYCDNQRVTNTKTLEKFIQLIESQWRATKKPSTKRAVFQFDLLREF